MSEAFNLTRFTRNVWRDAAVKTILKLRVAVVECLKCVC